MLLMALLLLAAAWGHAEDIKINRSPDIGDHYFKVEPDSAKLSKLCSVYVPAYSHIFLTEKETALLAITLSIRNVDATAALIISKIDYFDTRGKLVEKLVTDMFGLAPMATASFVIEQRDRRGGAGANFIVEWGAKTRIRQPIIETIMAGYVGTRGLSFSSRGVELDCQARP